MNAEISFLEILGDRSHTGSVEETKKYLFFDYSPILLKNLVAMSNAQYRNVKTTGSVDYGRKIKPRMDA